MLRAYKDLYCVKFVDSDFTWESTDYSHIMLDSSDTIPTNVSISELLNTSVVPDSPAATGTISHVFISPDIFDIVSIIDGTASMTFRLYSHVAGTGASSSYAEITSVDVTIDAVDNNGNSRELFSGTLWTGSHKATLGETLYLGIMKWFNIGKKKIEYTERVKLTIDLDYSAYDPVPATPTGMSIGIACSADDKDMTLSLPFIV
jgi:hypothetical protein